MQSKAGTNLDHFVFDCTPESIFDRSAGSDHPEGVNIFEFAARTYYIDQVNFENRSTPGNVYWRQVVHCTVAYGTPPPGSPGGGVPRGA